MTEDSLAFVFPGQGSQKTGMLSEALATYSCARDTLDEASDALGQDVLALINNENSADLNLTENTQPVLLACSVALWRVWLEQGLARPAVMAGHSLGEFSALTCSGALEFADAVRLVRQRGQFMQTAVPVGEGAMAAVMGLEDAQVQAVCHDVSAQQNAVVEAVNYNSPGQIVIAGHTAAVESAIEALRAAGAKRAIALPVSAPFHTSLMVPAGERLAAVLADVQVSTPNIPVLHNVTAEPETDPVRIRELLVRQIASPVRWTDCMRGVVARGVSRVAECGPGRVLGGLNRRIDRSLETWYLETPEGVESLSAALA